MKNYIRKSFTGISPKFFEFQKTKKIDFVSSLRFLSILEIITKMTVIFYQNGRGTTKISVQSMAKISGICSAIMTNLKKQTSK